MQYTAIVKNGGLFIPNIFTEISNDGSLPEVVQVDLDIELLYIQIKDKHVQKNIPVTLTNKDNSNTETQKVNLGELPVKAFDIIDDPVAWQQTLREAW